NGRVRGPARDRRSARIWGLRSLVVRAGRGNWERALVCRPRRRYLGSAHHVHIGRTAGDWRVGGARIVCIWLIVSCRTGRIETAYLPARPAVVTATAALFTTGYFCVAVIGALPASRLYSACVRPDKLWGPAVNYIE